MEGDDTQRWMTNKWKHYKLWVKKGFKPVRNKVREQWCSAILQMTHSIEMANQGTNGPIKVKYTEEGSTIVTGGDERTQRKVARCIGGTPASRARVVAATEAADTKTKQTNKKTSTIMWRRARVRSEVLDKMRQEIQNARTGRMEEEMVENEHRHDKPDEEDEEVHTQNEGTTMEEGEPKPYEDELDDEWARTIRDDEEAMLT